MATTTCKTTALVRGDTFVFCLCIKANGFPVDLSGSAFQARFVTSPGGVELFLATSANGDIEGRADGMVILKVSDTSDWPVGRSVAFDVRWTDTASVVRTVVTRLIQVTKSIFE